MHDVIYALYCVHMDCLAQCSKVHCSLNMASCPCICVLSASENFREASGVAEEPIKQNSLALVLRDAVRVFAITEFKSSLHI